MSKEKNPYSGVVSPMEKFRRNAVVVVAFLLAVVFATTIALTIRNNDKLTKILEDSVKSELIATCNAARNEIDIDLFLSLNSKADILENQADFDNQVARLKKLCDEVGATYIYTLKEVDGKYYFIFDTDEELGDSDVYPYFSEYELSAVHEQAFAGVSSADIMNVDDIWGSFNTGAVPLFSEGRVVGIISVDFEDAYIERGRQTATTDAILLIVVLSVAMGLLIIFLVYQTRRNKKMNEDLDRLVNNDFITGLPNRYYFFNYFAQRKKKPEVRDDPYALLFIDLDNFKLVNDCAGHDVGDDLLRRISTFLRSYSDGFTGTSNIRSMTARIGGDEFLQTVPGISTAEELTEYSAKMLSDFAGISELQSFIEKYGVGLSIGGALFPSQTDSYDELARFADIAMYHAKFNGKNNFVLYDESMGTEVENEVLSIRGSRG